MISRYSKQGVNIQKILPDQLVKIRENTKKYIIIIHRYRMNRKLNQKMYISVVSRDLEILSRTIFTVLYKNMYSVSNHNYYET